MAKDRKNTPATRGGVQTKKTVTREGKVYASIVETAVRRTRYDMGMYRKAQQAAENEDNPNPVRLYDMYSDILIDALLTSQMENRKLQVTSMPYGVQDAGGAPNDEYTALLRNSLWFPQFLSNLLDTIWWGHTLQEFSMENGILNVELIPRKHVRAKAGMTLKKQDDTKGIEYRSLKEYGSWIIEAGGSGQGLLNKAVPHVLMKRFAQSCWSEYCEIFGMPTRTLKTNTSDPAMLNRAEDMMRRMGAAGWAVIDETEMLEYAEANSGNGEVYNALITMCNSELSLLNSGAIIGQDTEHGTRGKEQVSQDMLNRLVAADTAWVENYCNATLLPALYRIGCIPDGLKLAFRQEEDMDGLWTKVAAAMPFYNIDPEWIADRFGIPVSPRTAETAGLSVKTLNAETGFFG
jgi:phage gp29-like protein